MKKYFTSEDMALLSELYSSHKGIMYKTALDALGGQDELEDVVQESILRLLQNIDRLRGLDPKARAVYVARTVYTAAMDAQRRAARERRRFVGLDEQPELGGTGSPESALIERESLALRLSLLREALSELSDTDAELLIGKYINGESDESLAERLGLRVGTIRVRLTRAKHRARKLIEDKEAEHER